MSKRMFQILDEMNVMDTENKTALIGVCADFVSAQKTKAGGHVTMGVPGEVLMDLISGKNKVAVLLIIDKPMYDKIAESK